MASDEDLVGRVARGDPRALAALLERWNRPLHSFLARQTGGDEGDLEDLRQDTWMRVVRAADRFDGARRFSTWLFQIALNLCRDRARRARETPLPPEAAERALGKEDGHPRSPEDRPDARLDARLDAQALLDTLPEAQRSTMILRYYHGFSEEETAAVMGCPRGTVKSRLHQAVTKLLALTAAEDAR